jgi:Domain of unknown function (DUF4291)
VTAVPTPMMTCAYGEQASAWPARGRHILARYDTDSIYVYQAYRPSIAQYALQHQRFGVEEILSIEDMTPFVKEQVPRLAASLDDLLLPQERVYPTTPEAALRLGIEYFAVAT